VYRNILIPTDGSELAQKAVEYGVRLGKTLGARVTALDVTEPFHLLSVAPGQIEYTRNKYKKHTDVIAAKALGAVSAAADRAGVGCETVHVDTSTPSGQSSTPPKRGAASDRDGPRTGRRGVAAVALGSERVKDPLAHPGARLPLRLAATQRAPVRSGGGIRHRPGTPRSHSIVASILRLAASTANLQRDFSERLHNQPDTAPAIASRPNLPPRRVK